MAGMTLGNGLCPGDDTDMGVRTWSLRGGVPSTISTGIIATSCEITYVLVKSVLIRQVVRTNRDPYHIGCAFLARHLVNVFFLFVLHILEVCGRADHEHEGAQQHSQYHTYNRRGGNFFHRRQGHRVVCLLRQRHKGDIRLSNVCSRQ